MSQEQLGAIISRVQRERGLSARELGVDKLSRGAEAELLSTLGRAGLEHTGKAIRVPLREQLRTLTARAGELGVAEAMLMGEVKGARSTAELRLVAAELVDEGLLVRVLDGDVARLAAPGPHHLSDVELSQLGAVAQQLAALAKATRAEAERVRPTVARSALQAPLAMLRELARARDDTPVHAALRAAFLVAPATAGLIRVPDVIRALEQLHPRPALLSALGALARQGVLELRPEASLTRIAEDDRVRSPVAIDGTPLSYARIKPQTPGAHP